jgi:hypothetical protein
MHRPHRRTYVIAGVVLLGFLGFSVFALFFNIRGGEHKEFMGRVFAGKVTAVSDASTFRVKDARGIEKAFTLRPGTNLIAGKGDMPPERLNEGMFVMVEFIPGETDPLDAYEVRILTTNSFDGFKLHRPREESR